MSRIGSTPGVAASSWPSTGEGELPVGGEPRGRSAFEHALRGPGGARGREAESVRAGPLRRAEAAEKTAGVAAAAGDAPPLVRRLASVFDQGVRVDALIAKATTAGPLGPRELLGAQLTIYRYDEAVQLLSQVVDHTDSAVKEVLRTST